MEQEEEVEIVQQEEELQEEKEQEEEQEEEEEEEEEEKDSPLTKSVRMKLPDLTEKQTKRSDEERIERFFGNDDLENFNFGEGFGTIGNRLYTRLKQAFATNDDVQHPKYLNDYAEDI